MGWRVPHFPQAAIYETQRQERRKKQSSPDLHERAVRIIGGTDYFSKNSLAKYVTSNSVHRVGRILAVQYDLGAQAESSSGVAIKPSRMLAGTIDVGKKIRVGKAAATNIDVKLGSGTHIYVNAAQLSSIFENAGKGFGDDTRSGT